MNIGKPAYANDTIRFSLEHACQLLDNEKVWQTDNSQFIPVCQPVVVEDKSHLILIFFQVEEIARTSYIFDIASSCNFLFAAHVYFHCLLIFWHLLAKCLQACVHPNPVQYTNAS